MIRRQLTEIEEQVRGLSSLDETQKQDLLARLSALRKDVDELAATRREQAHSIAAFAGLSTHEATRREPDSRLLELSLEGLSSSVRDFEESHPRLVENVNAICTMLSNLGI